MTKTKTKTVLGRVFTWDSTGPAAWRCSLSHGRVAIWGGDQHEADKAAILALQSTLRKMAELEDT